MAHWHLPQPSPSNNVPSNDFPSNYAPSNYVPSNDVPANNEDSDSLESVYSVTPHWQDIEDHRRVVIYSSFYDQAVVAHSVTSTAAAQLGGVPVMNNIQPLTATGLLGPQQSYYEPPVYIPNQFNPSQHFQNYASGPPAESNSLPPIIPTQNPLAAGRDSNPLAAGCDSNWLTPITPTQNSVAAGRGSNSLITFNQSPTYPLAAGSVPHEQFSFQGGPVNQPQLPYLVPPPGLSFPPQQQQQGEIDYPPVYLTTANVARTPASNLLVPPAYNYVTNHPSSAGNRFLATLVEKGAYRTAHMYMDASSDMWIHACENVIGKDGPSDILLDRVFKNAGFRQMLRSPHLRAENCTITVAIPAEGRLEVVNKEVPIDPNNVDFVRAFRNELFRVPDRIYEHLWRSSRRLLQPSTLRAGIFTTAPGSPVDPAMEARLKWAFTKNEQWGFGIFHEIIEDEHGFRIGRWFQNLEFIDMFQEGVFDVTSPGWFGFIEATRSMSATWKVMECPSAHIFAVALSWLVVTARCDFLKMCSVTLDWVSNTRIDQVKETTKFLEDWMLRFWMQTGVDSQTLAERAEGMAFMLRHGPSPLQAI